MTQRLAPVTLTGDLVVLEPLTPEHHDGLVEAVNDGEVWRLSYTRVPHPEAMAAEIAARLARAESGEMLPFIARRRSDGAVVGMTSFCNIDLATPRLEVGYTWNAASTRRTGTNTESKLLLLGHAFETVEVVAVEFRTHWLNRQSRAAIERLGARLDGILRSHLRMPDGSLRDTAVYSVVASEWPAVRAELQRRLAAG